MSGNKSWFDWLGVAASFGCAIHCAAMPFVITFLPVLGLSFLADEGFHQVTVGVCLVLAAAAFVPGWRRHRRFLPAGIAAAGLALISTAAFALEGSCCAACQTAVSQKATEETDTQASDECTEECCEHCAAAKEATKDQELLMPTEFQSETSAEGEVGTTEQTVENHPEMSKAGFTLPLIPWVTPIGGLLLILAHVANHLLMCRQECCTTNHST